METLVDFIQEFSSRGKNRKFLYVYCFLNFEANVIYSEHKFLNGNCKWLLYMMNFDSKLCRRRRNYHLKIISSNLWKVNSTKVKVSYLLKSIHMYYSYGPSMLLTYKNTAAWTSWCVPYSGWCLMSLSTRTKPTYLRKLSVFRQ